MGIDPSQTTRGNAATVSSCNLVDRHHDKNESYIMHGKGTESKTLGDFGGKGSSRRWRESNERDDAEAGIPRGGRRPKLDDDDDEKEEHREPEAALVVFRGHIRKFYESGLSIPMVVDEDAAREEKKVDGNDGNSNSAANSVTVEGGKMALEALDRCSAALHLATAAAAAKDNESLSASLESSLEATRKAHCDALACPDDAKVLRECGLCDLSVFLADGDGERRIQAYLEARDFVRRECHRVAMVFRRDALFELISRAEREREMASREVVESIAGATATTMATVAAVQETIGTLERFVSKYRSDLGSHPFLAGLRRFIETQLSSSEKNEIVRWTFRGAVITEACHQSRGTSEHTPSDNYAREATQSLFSFAVLIKDADVDVEGGEDRQLEEAPEEATLSFEIDRSVSDNNLRRILSYLPSFRELEARATGKVRMLDASGDDGSVDGGIVQPRINADGRLDEVWPWFGGNWASCDIL